MVHQKSSFIDDFTLKENILCGIRGWSFSRKKVRKKLDNFNSLFEQKLDLDKITRYASTIEVHKSEILSLLMMGVNLIIIDEPVELGLPSFQSLLNLLKSMGISLILISHHIEAIINQSDRILVMDDGKIIEDKRKSDSTFSSISDLIFSKEVNKSNINKNNGFDISNLFSQLGYSFHDNSKNENIYSITSWLNSEIEKIEQLLGPLILKLNGNWIPSQRWTQGVSEELSVEENLIIRERESFYANGLLQKEKKNTWVSEIIEQNKIVASPTQTTKTLSGGNLQKLLLARESGNCRTILLAVNPTKGLDPAHQSFLLNRLNSLSEQGVTIIVLNEDPEDAFKIGIESYIIKQNDINRLSRNDSFDNMLEEMGRLK